jgi:hypothetical protein
MAIAAKGSPGCAQPGMNSASSPGTLRKRPSCRLRLASSLRGFEPETKFHQMCRGPSIGALVAAGDDAVDDVGGLLTVSGPSSTPSYRYTRYTEGRATRTGEVECSDLSGVTVKQHCCLETALPWVVYSQIRSEERT